jgi:hypothetical protein
MSDNISRRWRDGSLELDLPTFLLSEMFNCNHFIVSQTNPHIVPLLNLKKNLSKRWANLLELELRHRCVSWAWVICKQCLQEHFVCAPVPAVHVWPWVHVAAATQVCLR